MKGSIRAQGRNSWQITIDIGTGPGGKRERYFETVKGIKADAQRRLRELLTSLDSGVPIHGGRMTVGQYLDTWLSDVVAVRVRPGTIRSYTTIVRKHLKPAIGNIELRKLQPAHVRRLEANMMAGGLSANTASHVHVVLSLALKDAMKEGILGRNVCLLVDKPQPAPYEVEMPPMEGIKAILRLAKATPYLAIYHFIAYTGVRRGEALGLKRESVDLDRKLASIVATLQSVKGKLVLLPPKSSAGRRGIALDTSTVAMLREHLGRQLLQKTEAEGAYQDTGLLFAGPGGEALVPEVVSRTWARLARQAGYPGLRLHDLRHAHAGGLILAGEHPKVVQDRLGHASAAFTMQVYGHLSAGMQERAAESFADLMDNGPE